MAAFWPAAIDPTTWRHCGPTASRPWTWSSSTCIPLPRAAAKPDIEFDHLVEEIDIGGPSLLRAAAKNFRDVLVVVDPADYDSVLAALDAAGGPTLAVRFDLARRAIAHTAAYDQTIASTLLEFSVQDAGRFVRDGEGRRAAAGSVGAGPHEESAICGTARIRISPARGIARTPAGLAAPSCIRARNCRSRICSIWTRPRASRWSSTSRPRW